MNTIKKYWLLLVITAVGIALRYYHNLDISLWHDEAFSALYIKYPWEEMMHRIGLDVHPPLYYIALRFWHYIFGDSLLSLRSFSIAFGAGLIPLSYAFVKEAFHNRKAALWVALLTALNPFQLEYVTEVRMYTFGAFFGLLAAYFLVKALRTQKTYTESLASNTPHMPEMYRLRKWMLLQYAGFALAISAVMYTHYYLFFTAAALGLYAVWYQFHTYRTDFKKYWPLLASFGLIGLLYLPWLRTFLFQFSQVSESYWIPKMDIWSIPTTIWQMMLAFGIDISSSNTKIFVALVTLFTILFLTIFIRRTQEKAKWLVLLAVIGPFAGALLFALLARVRGQESSVFLVRYFLFASVFYTIALGVWLAEIKPKRLGCLTLVVVYAGLNIFAFLQHWSDLNVTERQGMTAAAKYLEQHVDSDDKLYVGSSFEFFNYKFYNRTPVTPLLFSGGNRDIKNMPHFAGTAILTNEDLVPDFAESTATGDTVWLLWTNGFGGSKPSVPINFVQVDEKGFEDVRPYPGTWIIVTQYFVK
jgi:mannosyltransferase